MPVVKISLNDEYYEKLSSLAKEDGISMQDYIRNKVFGDTVVYTPADAVEKALVKFKPGDLFTVPMIYGEDWNIKRGMAGVFGKQFFNYVEDNCSDKIKFVGMTNYGRHAQYQML